MYSFNGQGNITFLLHSVCQAKHTQTHTHTRVLGNWAVGSVLAESPVSHHHSWAFSIRLACVCSSPFTGKTQARTNPLQSV